MILPLGPLPLKAARDRLVARSVTGAVFNRDAGSAPAAPFKDAHRAAPGLGAAPPTNAHPQGPSDSSELDEDALLEAEAEAIRQEATDGSALAIPGDDLEPPPMNDEPLAHFGPVDKGLVKLCATGGGPIPMTAYYAGVIESCADNIATLARNRSRRSARHRAGNEVRIVHQIDAILATGAGCITELMAWWDRSLESSDPWKIWALLVTLGSIEGGEGTKAIAYGLERLPPDARLGSIVAAEALAVVAHPDLVPLGKKLLVSPHPVARAVGVDVCARRGVLSIEEIPRYLRDPDVLVIEASLLALARLSPAPVELAPILLQRMLHPNPPVAWRATRLLSIWGFSEPHVEVRDHDELLSRLGSRALELFVLNGRAKDLERIEACLSRMPVDPDVLSAIGRFGHTGSWSFLTHFLADDELSEAAVNALTTLFGAKLPRPEVRRAAAWKSVIAHAHLDPQLRYRRGEPWHVQTVATELTSGDLPRDEIENRIDEVTVRSRVNKPVDLCLWTPDAEGQIKAFAAGAVEATRRRSPGTWE